MTAPKCLYCYQSIDEVNSNMNNEYHQKCSKKFFGVSSPPIIEFTLNDINKIVADNISKINTVTGVQKKISLGLANSGAAKQKKLTIVGFWDNFILKPPTLEYPQLQENESLTMNLAKLYKINTVPNSLIRLYSGELAYITRRIDREKGMKLPLEDMAQLTERMTEEKYRGSLEQVGKAIMKYSSNPGLDIIKFFEINLFAFITGNSDMHLKNFSLIYDKGMYSLAPAYDLVSTRLHISEKYDNEEFALTMIGKKSQFTKNDFLKFAENLKIPKKSVSNIFTRFRKGYSQTEEFIKCSFLNEERKYKYIRLVSERAKRIYT